MRKVKRSGIYTILLFAFLCDMTFIPRLKMLGALPDLPLMCVIFFGLFSGAGSGLEAGIIAGLMQDAFALDFFGINMFIYGLVGFFAGMTNAKVSRDSKTAQFLTVLSFTAFSMMLHYCLASAFSRYLNLGIVEFIFASVLPVSIYTSLVSIPVFPKLIDIFELREREEFL